MNKEKYIVLGTAFGAAIGSAVGVLTNNIGLSISLGVSFGVLIGIMISKKLKKGDGNKNWFLKTFYSQQWIFLSIVFKM